jgi:hypothetical protein
LVLARPADALPGVGVAASSSVGLVNDNQPVFNVVASAELAGVHVGGLFWRRVSDQRTYLHGLLMKDVSPIPMIKVLPGIGLASNPGGQVGPIASLGAAFHPFLLPVAVEVSAGAALFSGQTLLPYSAGLKLSLFPLTAFNFRYRGFGGEARTGAPGSLAGIGGPEVGVEIGI